MNQIYQKIKSLILSGTAKDTYILFFGNSLSAFLGFIYTFLVAKYLTVSDFGIFSAVTNMVIIVISLTDLGISTGLVNFVAENESKKNIGLSSKFIYAGTLLKLCATIVVILPFVFFPSKISNLFFSVDYNFLSQVTALISLVLVVPMLFPSILQGKRRFLASVVSDNALYLARLVASVLFILFFELNLENSLNSFVWGGLFATIVCIMVVGVGFLKAVPQKSIYLSLFKFSGWLGLNRIISSISGRLDVAMVATMLSSTETGIYSIPNRIAGFVTVMTASFAGVLAPRFASFGSKEEEKRYIKKASLALVPTVIFLVIWIIYAKEFILFLSGLFGFGNKYVESAPVLRLLFVSMIPFALTSVPVAAIIYAMKKTKFIGIFSFFQLAALFLLNLVFIPKYGIFGPAISLTVVNIILAIYTWLIVINHYWLTKNRI